MAPVDARGFCGLIFVLSRVAPVIGECDREERPLPEDLGRELGPEVDDWLAGGEPW